ncbi:MAG: glycosyl hydrolase [Oscillospiraceae bacterium]|nr:glycosyl hydrolase [Oscillospiraceae bacterium]
MNTKKLKNAACAMVTAALAGSCVSLPGSAADVKSDAEAVKYEFEDGSNNGGEIYTEGWKGNTQEDGSGEEMDLTGFSGSGFSYLDQKGTTVSVDVTVPERGLYELSICYCEPYDTNKKVQYLNINGVNQGEVSFQHNLSFEETSGGVVMLDEGVNTIELKAYWGYTFFDYLTVKPADESLTNLSPTRQLSNPNASDSTKRLYSYLCDQYGNHIISGQQEYCGDHNYNLWNDPDTFIKDNEAEFEYILEKTGKQPAIRGIDFLAYNTTTEWRDHAPERCIEWTNKYHGIATCTWHWNVPCEEGSTETAFYVKSANATYTTFSITNALTEGTWENEVLLADIDLIAQELTKLKEADVPILWRPLHEAEGGWFWWGAEGAEPCKKLYRLLYDKLTNEYGLDNLIWVWTGYTYETSADWYPGDDVVDIIGYDKYNAVDGLPNLSSISSTFYSLVQSTGGEKMVAMSENDSIPSLENLQKDKAAWLYFCPWYMNYLTSEQNNPVDNLIEIYNSEYCITLDELPDLKTYPINGAGEQGTTAPVTGSTKPSSGENEILYGDADLNGEINVNDVVTVMCYAANPDDNPLLPDALRAADVYDAGGGVNASDAVEIQKFIAKIISEFNIGG